jgi:EAL domain-containing protein (putative c-di-GMP-specific phosphodiesterase class I)
VKNGRIQLSKGTEKDFMTCAACRDGATLDFSFDMALQPIMDADRRAVWGYEALVRGTAGEGAAAVLGRVNEQNRYKFDQACRVKAIETARARFDAPDLYLSINFLPNAVYEPAACIRATIEAAKAADFPLSRIMFEFTEDEMMRDPEHVNRIVKSYKEFGFLTALDDFGAGYSGLSRFAETQTDLVKIDMNLIRGVERSRPRRAIIRGLAVMTKDLGVQLLAEGVETRDEYEALREAGINLFQGYLFGRPSLSRLDSGALWPLAMASSLRQAI